MADHANGNGLAGLAEPARNRYFYGKLLDAANLEMEQRYLNRKRWLMNRLVTGAGVLCGLDVVVANDGRRLVVRPGVALDGVGREIVVPRDAPAIDPRRPTDEHGRAGDTAIAGAGTVTVCLAYHECPGDPVPVLVADCDTENGSAAGSVRERYAIVVREGAPPVLERPARLSGLFASDPSAILPELGKRLAGACPEPGPAAGCVVLARVTLAAQDTAPPIVETADVRPLVATNTVLLEMILSLAERVEECCRNHQ